MSPRLQYASAAICSAAVAATIVWAVLGDGGGEAPAEEPAGAEAGSGAQLQIFSAPQRRGDDPRRAAPDLILPPALSDRFGVRYEQARRLRERPRAFAVAGDGVVCLLSDLEGASCSPGDRVGENFVVSRCGGLPEGSALVSGLVPDGFSRGWVLLEGGARVPAQLRRNYLTARFASSETAVAVELADREGGTVRRPVPEQESRGLRCSS